MRNYNSLDKINGKRAAATANSNRSDAEAASAKKPLIVYH